MDIVKRQRTRQSVREIKILRRNMLVTARFMQNEWRSLSLDSYLRLCGQLDEINAQLDIRYKYVWETLNEYNLGFLRVRLELLEGLIIEYMALMRGEGGVVMRKNYRGCSNIEKLPMRSRIWEILTAKSCI